MCRIRFFQTTILHLTFALIAAHPALAWELHLSSATTFSYLHYTQMGNHGFFGGYDVDESKTIDWRTRRIVPLMDYGAVNGVAWDPGEQFGLREFGYQSSFSTSFYPILRVNKAISVSGIYRTGNVDTGQFPGATTAFSAGEWLQWWMNVNTPLGLASFGKRLFAFGCGLQYDVGNRTEEAVTLTSRYGPVVFNLGFYPWRSFRQNPRNTERVYWNAYDTSNSPNADLLGFINYGAANLEAGIGGFYCNYDLGPEGFAVRVNRESLPRLSATSTEGWIFAKYNNGRFFFNAEADWNYRTARWQRSETGSFEDANGVLRQDNRDDSGSIFRPQYTEAWRYMTELGFTAGPGRFSFLYAFIPGPDRRHGVLIDRQTGFVDLYRPTRDEIVHNPDQSSAGVFRPYCMLINTAYAGGVNALNRNGDGYITDASVLAARFDYAVAANLLVYGTVLTANRVSHGYGWGFITPVMTGTSFVIQFDRQRNYTVPRPAIPDNALGWEFNAGLDWELLDSLELNVRFGYWLPGKWFNFACIDKGLTYWNNPGPANWWGVNPARKIDPVFALDLAATMSF